MDPFAHMILNLLLVLTVLNIVISSQEEKKEKLNEISSNNKKVGRNEKCPCGSGKKYKHCCGSV